MWFCHYALVLCLCHLVIKLLKMTLGKHQFECGKILKIVEPKQTKGDTDNWGEFPSPTLLRIIRFTEISLLRFVQRHPNPKKYVLSAKFPVGRYRKPHNCWTETDWSRLGKPRRVFIALKASDHKLPRKKCLYSLIIVPPDAKEFWPIREIPFQIHVNSQDC